MSTSRRRRVLDDVETLLDYILFIDIKALKTKNNWAEKKIVITFHTIQF